MGFLMYYYAMNIALVATETVWKDVNKNIGLVERHVQHIKQSFPNAQVVLFPEISLAGFIVDSGNKDIAISLEGDEVERLKQTAKKHEIALICGMVESNPTGKPYNTQFVISKDGELITSYRKNHLFTESAEPEVYSPGEWLVTFELEGWLCGLSTCFDIRFPRLFEAYKKAGVECMFSGFNWVEGRNKSAIMENLVRARAHENQFFFAAVDRSGADPNTSYYGTALVANPYAEDIAKHEGIYAYAEIEKEDIETLSKTLPLRNSFKSEYIIHSKE